MHFLLIITNKYKTTIAPNPKSLMISGGVKVRKILGISPKLECLRKLFNNVYFHNLGVPNQ